MFTFSELDIEGQNAPYDYRNHYDTQKQLAEEAEEEEEELRTRVNDLKNRIELRRMLSEYSTGSLKPPIFYKDGIAAPEDLGQNDEVEAVESIFEDQPPQNKRLVLSSQHNDVHHGIDETEDFDEFPLKSLFREHQRPKYIVEDIGDDAFDERNNDPNEYHRRLFKINRPKAEQSAVYTEGGLVYGPSAHATLTQHRKRKLKSYNICALDGN